MTSQGQRHSERDRRQNTPWPDQGSGTQCLRHELPGGERRAEADRGRRQGRPRTPDIIVQPNVGVVYTGNSAKQAEHGGFAQDDTNVMLLVSKPGWSARTITSFVETTQVAPTILQALGLDTNSLDAVQKEGTPVLPGLPFKP
jgi:arylsulfatase A-like enzyme